VDFIYLLSIRYLFSVHPIPTVSMSVSRSGTVPVNGIVAILYLVNTVHMKLVICCFHLAYYLPLTAEVTFTQ